MKISDNIKNLKEKIQKLEVEHNKCFKELKEELKETWTNHDHIKNVARRTLCFYIGQYQKYDFDTIGKNYLKINHWRESNYVNITKEQSYEGTLICGFIFKLDNIMDFQEIKNDIVKLWIYHCENDRFRGGLDEFKKLKPKEILTIYENWLNKENRFEWEIEIINEKALKLKDVVIIIQKDKIESW